MVPVVLSQQTRHTTANMAVVVGAVVLPYRHQARADHRCAAVVLVVAEAITTPHRPLSLARLAGLQTPMWLAAAGRLARVALYRPPDRQGPTAQAIAAAMAEAVGEPRSRQRLPVLLVGLAVRTAAVVVVVVSE